MLELKIACPECGAEMVRRINRQNQSEFYGCARYPDCTATRGIPEYVRLIEQGAAVLPGFE